MTGNKRSRLTVASTIENGSLWMLGHASRVWPFVVIAVVLSLSWQAVRQIHPREFSEAIHALDVPGSASRASSPSSTSARWVCTT